MKKRLHIAYIVFLLAFICFLLFVVLGISPSFFARGTTEKLSLSDAQKREDFEFFYSTILDSVPMIDLYEDLYGFSFAERKDLYLSQIAATDNDYEFYCVLDAISQEIPSFHTDLVEPIVSSYKSLHCFNSMRFRTNRKTISACAYWEELVFGAADQNRDKSFFCFDYVDGQYVFNHLNSAFHEQLRDHSTLHAINGEDADDYIKNHLLVYDLYYDGQYKKPCRTKIVFNQTSGTPVTLSLSDDQGESYSVSLFYSLYDEEAYRFMTPSAVEDYSVYESDQFVYVAINSFSSPSGSVLSDSLQALSQDTIILDLRNCYGGNQDFAAKYLYPYLFSKTYIVPKTWYVPESSANRAVYNNLLNRVLYHFRRTDGSPFSAQSSYLSSTTQRTYTGRGDEKRVYILTSRKTGSAADEFVSIVKHYDLGTIIGNNTGGEGLEGSYMVLTCPNSQLAFVYMPGGSPNPDGTDNSVFGTAPDFYVSQSKEDYLKLLDSNPDSDVESFESMLETDTVLRFCVELLSQES